jgi:hypothetical protein
MSLTGKIMDFFADKEMTIPAFPRTKVKAISDDNNVGLNVLLDNKQDKVIAKTVSLTTAGWNNMVQSVSIDGVTANSIVIINPAPQSYSNYCTSGIHCSGQADRELEFTCTSAPSSEVFVSVLIFN